MRIFAVALLLVLLAMQYRLWVSDDGVRSVMSLKRSVAAQKLENQALARRNGELGAEVKDLKEGLAAIEERARTDIGMVGANETFFQVVDGEARQAVEPAQRLPIQRTSH